MKDRLRELLGRAVSPLHGRNIAREYLQARILGSLQRSGAMIALAFQGGTALRFLYSLPRHSEDLDFALEGSTEDYDFRSLIGKVRARLAGEGYEPGLKVSDSKVIHSAFLRFPGLLYEIGLSPHRDEVLAIRIEVDTNPPAGAGLETTVVRRHVTLQLYHHDRPSLLSGKLHALLQRPFAKGRDLYDLLWYLSDPEWPGPNLTLLNNALEQTGWRGEQVREDTWRPLIAARITDLDWIALRADVAPFLEDSSEVDLLTQANLLRLLENH